MNIHEYQAKAVLREFGVPVPRGTAAFSVEEAVKAAHELGSPGRGGQGADPCRRARQGRRRQGRASRSTTCAARPSGCSARCWSPTRPARTASRSTGSISRKARRSSASSISRRWSIAKRHASRSWCRPKAAWTSRRWRARSPEKIVTFSVDPATGIMPHHGRRVAQALGLTGDLAKQAESSSAKLYTAFVAKDMSLLEINPLVVTKDDAADLPRRQDRLRRQRALSPSGHRRAARPHRGGREGDRGVEIRPQLRRARRHHRLHGQRRRARHGDHGHHQALRRGAGELPRRRRRRQQGEGGGGVQDHHLRSRR